MVNASLLEATITHIKDFPELHNQGGFFEMTEYGLAACFGARALLLAGFEAVISQEIGSVSSLVRHPVTRETSAVWSTARQVLALPDGPWAGNLFGSINTAGMLELKVKDLLNGSPMDRYSGLFPGPASR